VTRADLKAGTLLTAADVEVIDVPERVAPGGAIGNPDDVIGRTLSLRLPARAPLVPTLVTQSPDVGRSVVPIRLGDEALAAYLEPGMAVQLVQVGTEGVSSVIADAHITAMSSPDGGKFSMGADGHLVLVDVPTESAAQVSVLGQQGDLAVVLGAG